MSILDDIKEKAKGLLNIAEPYATRQTKGYDASKNSVVVAGFPLDSVVSSVVSSDSITRQETGIDQNYTTYYEVITARTLTVTLLPTASCLPVLRLLALKQLENKGWFNISVNENDTIVNTYRGWIMDLPELDMRQEAGDRVITFGIKPIHAGVAVIDQTDNQEQTYSRVGSRPDLGGANIGSTINESTGELYTPMVEVGDLDSYEEYLGNEDIPYVPDDGS